MNKKEFRNQYLKIRQQIKDKKIDQKIQNKLFNLDEFKKADSIFLTVSKNSEIDTTRIIDKSLDLGKRVFIPKVQIENKKIIPVEIKSFPENLIKGAFDILEPKDFPDIEEVPEITIVPGLVFDKNGYRIGYGGGYYDRYLKKVNTDTISLVYDYLIVDSIPITNQDVPVNSVITEKRIFKNDNNRRY